MAKLVANLTPLAAPYQQNGDAQPINAEIATAGASYTQAQMQLVIDLVNDLRQLAVNLRKAK